MLLPTKIQVVLAIGLSSLHFTSGDVNCDSNIARKETYGLSYGLWFCAMRIHEGQFVTGIKMWAEKSHNGVDFPRRTKGIEVKYADGQTTMIGQQYEDVVEIGWDPADVSVSYATGVASELLSEPAPHVRTIIVRLSDGQVACQGAPYYCYWSDGHTSSNGVLLGVSGKTGTYGVEEITYHMLDSRATAARIHDVVFTPSIEQLNGRQNQEDRGLYNQSIGTAYFVNRLNDTDSKHTYSTEKTFKHIKTWTHTTANTWHLGSSLEIEFELFDLSGTKAKGEFWWEHKRETGKTDTEETWDTVKASAEVVLKPGRAARVTAWTVQGKWDVTWTGKNEIKFENGQTVDISVSGSHTGVTFSDVWITVEDASLQEAKDWASSHDGQDLFDGNGVAFLGAELDAMIEQA